MLDRDLADLDFEQAADAFRRLGDPTRVAILAALAVAERRDDPELTFAELRQQAGVDDSGRFNYHLNELQPHFVQSTEEGYRIRYAGREAYGLIKAGAAPEEIVERHGQVDQPCPVCGGALECRYEGDRLVLDCENHETIANIPIPPTTARDRPLQELVKVAEAAAEQDLLMADYGICDACWGPVTGSIETPPQDLEIPDALLAIRYVCEHCDQHLTVPVSLIISSHPAVAGFLYDHGIDLSQYSLLDRFNRLHVAEEHFDADSGWIAFEADGDFLLVEFDATGGITDVSQPAEIPAA